MLTRYFNGKMKNTRLVSPTVHIINNETTRPRPARRNIHVRRDGATAHTQTRRCCCSLAMDIAPEPSASSSERPEIRTELTHLPPPCTSAARDRYRAGPNNPRPASQPLVFDNAVFFASPFSQREALPRVTGNPFAGLAGLVTRTNCSKSRGK